MHLERKYLYAFLDIAPLAEGHVLVVPKQEIDYIEDIDGQLSAVEFKWNPKRKAALPLSFSRSYPDVDFKVVTRENYESFLL